MYFYIYVQAGLPGIANIAIILVYKLHPNHKEAIGMIVPILAFADVAALFIYRKYATLAWITSLLIPCLVGVRLG